jgi:hypothetical protein
MNNNNSNNNINGYGSTTNTNTPSPGAGGMNNHSSRQEDWMDGEADANIVRALRAPYPSAALDVGATLSQAQPLPRRHSAASAMSIIAAAAALYP